jgi:hypothetical protein
VKEVAGDIAKNDSIENNDAPKAIKGIYVTADAAASNKINDLVKMVDSTEINAMVIDVKGDQGKISYAMNCAMAKKIGAVTNSIPNNIGGVRISIRFIFPLKSSLELMIFPVDIIPM